MYTHCIYVHIQQRMTRCTGTLLRGGEDVGRGGGAAGLVQAVQAKLPPHFIRLRRQAPAPNPLKCLICNVKWLAFCLTVDFLGGPSAVDYLTQH
jgi:hypothetical protein